jgi:hypothetical protein
MGGCLKRAALLTAAALTLTAAPSHADVRDNPAAHSGENTQYVDQDRFLGRTHGRRPKVFVVGDSMVYEARLPKSWEVSAVPGRDVSTLPYYIRDRTANRSRLRTVVIALGTNASAGWNRESYTAAIARLPRKTRVVFVSTFRDPVIFSRSAVPYRQQAWVQSFYSMWMGKIAAKRKYTCVVPWRQYVTKNSTAVHDGVHPSPYGMRAYVKMLTKAVKRCR